jgi:hypothetical protein
MSVLVSQADEQIDNIETTAAGVQDNMEAGQVRCLDSGAID